jgi:hypothetical protein
MAVLLSANFEMNSTAEWSSVIGTPSVVTSAVYLGQYAASRVCLHSVGHTEVWMTSPRLAQKAW